MAQLLDVAYERDVTAAASARRHATAQLAAVDPRSREDIVLVVSELVTNAVLHGSGAIRLRLIVNEYCVRVEVDDDQASMGSPSLQSRGLDIVSAISTSCGTCPHGRGKTVWAEVSR